MSIKFIKRSAFLFFLSIVLFCCFCQKKSDDTKVFAKVGWRVISKESFDAFEKMKRTYPSNIREMVFPGRRPTATLCVETEAIYRKAKSVRADVKKSNDWKWKKIFFPAQLYLSGVLDLSWGFSDSEIEAYYNEHKDEFKKIIKVKVYSDSASSDSTSLDSASKVSVKDSVKDSLTYYTYNAVKGKISRLLFLAENPPDSAFYASMVDTADSVVDTVRIENQWVNKVRRNLPDFFMKKIYKNHFGIEYPDSLKEVCGEGKIITPDDMKVIMNWLPEGSRERYETPEKQRYLAEWLLKWKLFSEEAKMKGFTKRKENKEVIKWAWKYEVVIKYVNSTLIEKIEKSIVIDTLMCVFKHWDRTGKPGIFPDSASLSSVVESNIKSKTQVALDEAIYSMRKKARITFLQSDFVDEKNKDPEEIAAEADSLYGAGSSKEAEKIYRKLVDNFPFSPKGQNALVELAKILTEKEKYTEAIKNYRRFLLISSDIERRCNIFFMIGFVYGEYLNKPELAEASYKWILKNTPECELSDDAEFMCLHLDEPMIGVEELQAEAKRQGRKIEEEEQVPEEKQVS